MAGPFLALRHAVQALMLAALLAVGRGVSGVVMEVGRGLCCSRELAGFSGSPGPVSAPAAPSDGFYEAVVTFGASDLPAPGCGRGGWFTGGWFTGGIANIFTRNSV
jgi:hypothetical protein